jgi:hypothetical protein
MNAPLAPPAAFEGTGLPRSPAGLPKELRDAIRHAVALLPRLGQWGCGAVGLLFCGAMSVCSFRALNSVGADSAANVMAADLVIIGLLDVVLFSHCEAVALPHLLSQLDERRVSAKTTATLRKMVKALKVLLGRDVLMMTGMAGTLAIGSISSTNPSTWYDWVAAAVLVATAPAFAVLASLTQGLPTMCYLLAADTAERVAADVQGAMAATVDYDALAKRIHGVDRDAATLSEKMTPIVLVNAGVLLSLVVSFLFFAVGPLPDRAEDKPNWYNVLFNEYLCALMATTMAVQLVWSLSGPAKVTSACQKIAAAINALRLNVDADGTVLLATSEQLHRIEGLKRYINELNKDQGLGFLVLRKRITFTLVVGMLIQTLSSMPVVIALMSIATGQHEVSHQDLMESLESMNRTLVSKCCECTDGG